MTNKIQGFNHFVDYINDKGNKVTEAFSVSMLNMCLRAKELKSLGYTGVMCRWEKSAD